MPSHKYFLYLFSGQAANVWGPGYILPTRGNLVREPDFVPESPIHDSMEHNSEMATQSILDMLQILQRSVESWFTSMFSNLESMNTRMIELGTRQKVLED